MKKLLCQWALSVVFLITPAFFIHADSSTFSSSVFSLTPPADVLIVTDLDARDQLNRPIHSSTVRQHFEDLWNRSLAQMFLSSLTPLKMKTLELLQTDWQHVRDFFRRELATLQHQVLAFFREVSSLINSAWRRQFLVLKNSNHLIHTIAGFGATYLTLLISSTRILR